MIKRALLILGIIAFAFCYAPNPDHVSAQFAQQQLSTSTGSANAQSVPLANYNLNVGVPITFIVGPGLNNTDLTTLNVNGTGVKAFRRVTNVGVFEMVGGELIAGGIATAIYDGTVYKQIGIVYQVGVVAEFRGAVAAGYAIEDGVCYSSVASKYVALGLVIGNTYGGCGAFSFRVPDSRGRGTAAADAQGAAGAANQLTSGLNGCNAVIGVNCFAPTSTLAIAQMPTHSVTGSVPFTPAGNINITDNGHTHNITQLAGGSAGIRTTFMDTQGGGVPNLTINFTTGTPITLEAALSTTGISAAFVGNGMNPGFTSNPVGSGSAIFPFAPNSIVYRAVKL